MWSPSRADTNTCEGRSHKRKNPLKPVVDYLSTRIAQTYCSRQEESTDVTGIELISVPLHARISSKQEEVDAMCDV
jgi:hypothetical protein